VTGIPTTPAETFASLASLYTKGITGEATAKYRLHLRSTQMIVSWGLLKRDSSYRNQGPTYSPLLKRRACIFFTQRFTQSKPHGPKVTRCLTNEKKTAPKGMWEIIQRIPVCRNLHLHNRRSFPPQQKKKGSWRRTKGAPQNPGESIWHAFMSVF